MKKIIMILSASMLMFSSAVFAQQQEERIVVQREKNVFVNPSDNEFLWKIGTGYAEDPGKFGLDLSFNYIYNIDPFFVAGIEGDFFWVSWDNKLEDVDAGGAAEGSLKAETNLYTFPLFVNAQLRLPMLKSKIHVEPFITVGLGYCFTILDYSSDAESGTDYYSGFAWQILASAAYKISDRSAVDFIFDFGYRGLTPDKDNIEIDMSGIITRVGVRIFI